MDDKQHNPLEIRSLREGVQVHRVKIEGMDFAIFTNEYKRCTPFVVNLTKEKLEIARFKMEVPDHLLTH